jgi:hypothetical protein
VAQGAFGAFDGERVPVIGKITMDLTMFDVTDLPEDAVNAGDWMELLGPTITLRKPPPPPEPSGAADQSRPALYPHASRLTCAREPAIAPGPAELN